MLTIKICIHNFKCYALCNWKIEYISFFSQSPATTADTRASLHPLFPELKLFLTALLELFLTGMIKSYLKFLMAKTFSLSPTETQSDLLWSTSTTFLKPTSLELIFLPVFLSFTSLMLTLNLLKTTILVRNLFWISLYYFLIRYSICSYFSKFFSWSWRTQEETRSRLKSRQEEMNGLIIRENFRIIIF